jgi:hypothetical protein
MSEYTNFQSHSEAFAWLERFYLSYCDGDWEHDFRCRIQTQSEPGWYFEFNLTGTDLEDRGLTRLEDHSGALKNITLRVEDKKFIGSCGPKQLLVLISYFRDFTEGKLPRPNLP